MKRQGFLAYGRGPRFTPRSQTARYSHDDFGWYTRIRREPTQDPNCVHDRCPERLEKSRRSFWRSATRLLRPPGKPAAKLDIRRVEIPLPELNRFMYVAVGRDFHWRERLKWSRDRWLAYMGRPELETWLACVAGTPAGYYEQELQPGGNAEIVNFGMLPQFVGQGLGGQLLVHAVRAGGSRGARRVWLHTCTLDHPRALAHYQARVPTL